MKLIRSLLAAVLSIPLATVAQNNATPTAPPPSTRAFRLVWTLEESDAGRHVSTQHFEMVVTTGGRTTTKVGSKVPVITGSYSASSAPNGVQTQFQYIDVGLNIDASLDDLGSGIRLRSKIEQSSVADEKSALGAGVEFHEPLIRQAVMEGTSLLIVGKPITLGSLDVPGSTHHLDVSVTLENIK